MTNTTQYFRSAWAICLRHFKMDGQPEFSLFPSLSLPSFSLPSFSLFSLSFFFRLSCSYSNSLFLFQNNLLTLLWLKMWLVGFSLWSRCNSRCPSLSFPLTHTQFCAKELSLIFEFLLHFALLFYFSLSISHSPSLSPYPPSSSSHTLYLSFRWLEAPFISLWSELESFDPSLSWSLSLSLSLLHTLGFSIVCNAISR